MRGQTTKNNIVRIKKTDDFTLSRKELSENWSETKWISLPIRKNESNYGTIRKTKIKILYSKMGIYFLFSCEDKMLTATMKSNFMKLWKEDVVEVFLWPDKDYPTYFEYELSPLNFELPLLISNKNGDLNRWRPYMYEGDRKTQHQTIIQGGNKKSGELIDKWIAKFFLPFKLFRPLNNIPPHSGTKWKANFYRIDYDNGLVTYEWQPVDKTFHEIKKFGSIIFE